MRANTILTMHALGTVLKADVTGQIMMKTQLSGMPECKLGMNDKILLDKETKMGKKYAVYFDDNSARRSV